MKTKQGGLPLDLGPEDGGAMAVRRRKSTRSARAHDDDEGTGTQRPEGQAAAATAPQPGRNGRGAAVNVRLSSAMLDAVDEAVKQSPIEFGNVSDFVRRAVESELRRRGLVKVYRD